MRVAVLGTGLLGRPVAERLRACGHAVTAYNRTAAKTEPLRHAGVAIASSPSEAVQDAELIVLLLTDAAAIRDVIGADATRHALSGKTIVQMGTIGPQDSRRLQQDLHAAGAAYLECPVLGSIAEAQTGKLVLMVGGHAEQFERWEGFLRCLGPHPRLVGPVGHAALLKLALNHLIAAETTAFALSLLLLQRSGVAVDTFMEIVRGSALYAPTFDKKLPRLLEHSFTNPNFSTRHLLKDVDLCLDEAHRVSLDTGPLTATRTILEEAVAQGLGDLDYSALVKVVGKPVHRGDVQDEAQCHGDR